MSRVALQLFQKSLLLFSLVIWHSAALPHDEDVQRCRIEDPSCSKHVKASDDVILLQKPALFIPAAGSPAQAKNPILVPLRRESVPVRRKGEIVSFKTSYSGEISVGRGPSPQNFRVVFDTGSGQVVLPSVFCRSESCLRHKQYNITQSTSGVPVNSDDSIVADDDETCDQVTVGYGTGSITGEFAKETVCLGQLCTEINLVMAIEMSTQPFMSFNFDGIVGLGLGALSLSEKFSFFGQVVKQGMDLPSIFGVFLSESEEGDFSEIAFGGYNSKRMLGDISWAPVPLAELGYWQVDILGIKVGNITMPFCQERGSCRGAVDTGSSHFGVPTLHFEELFKSLTVSSDGVSDCRQVDAPHMEILMDGFSLTIEAENYMRRLPLAPGVNPGGSSGSETNVFHAGKQDQETKCKPRLMPVNMAAPLGPNLFILGEPVLHRYYSVYDWQRPRVGFALAATKQNADKAEPLGDSILMVQMRFTLRVARRPRPL